MRIHGEQGPFFDQIKHDFGTGWVYITPKFCPSEPDKCEGCEAYECPKCREEMARDEDEGREFCWNCDDPVPSGWEAQFERFAPTFQRVDGQIVPATPSEIAADWKLRGF